MEVDRVLEKIHSIVRDALKDAEISGEDRERFLAAYHREIRDEYKYLLRG